MSEPTAAAARPDLSQEDVPASVSSYAEPKVDCHVHVFDPARFPYAADAPYAPAGAEIATTDQLLAVFDAYGVRNALVVGPNSGYGSDSRCLLDALQRGAGRLKGMAVVDNGVSRSELVDLRAAGVIGVTLNVALLGAGHYADSYGLLRMVADLGMFADVQVENEQLVQMLPLLNSTDARLLVDHCGRPDPTAGVDSPGFQALLRLADGGRTTVKLSGLVKCSRQSHPYRDAWPCVEALIAAYGCERLVWGSDWPFLRAPERIDYGPLLQLIRQLVPAARAREQLMWQTPRRLFDFVDSPLTPHARRS